MSKQVLGIGAAEAVLILITVIWGGTFLAVQIAMSVSGPMFFVGFRFGIAALALALLSWRHLRGFTALELMAGLFIGISITLGYCLQTVGLQTIPSSKSAFITALYVPFVPLLQWAVLRRPPSVMAWVGIVLAFIGLVLLAGPDGTALNFNVGEFVTLLCAMAIAAEIIMIGGYAGKVNARRVTVLQLAVASFFSFLGMVPAGESVPEFSWLLVGLAVGLGCASAAIQLAMNWAQRTVSPTKATLIYAGEPVWAGIVGRIAGERLGVAGLIGGGLIVLGVIVSELKLRRKAAAVEGA
ncbi:DMT family transporter [Lacibacterium aquatile]|uniref:DMT family transporter n=1 Tax=Lacibacterium aquatile TaxID=1168082 RepID=A0ABW5DUW2_9PROT